MSKPNICKARNMTKQVDDWREKIVEDVFLTWRLREKTTKQALLETISKTEEHFNELNLLGKRDKDLHYDREMLKRTREETARQKDKEFADFLTGLVETHNKEKLCQGCIVIIENEIQKLRYDGEK